MLNGHGAKFDTVPKKNYRFVDSAGESVVLMASLREPGMLTSRLLAKAAATTWVKPAKGLPKGRPKYYAIDEVD